MGRACEVEAYKEGTWTLDLGAWYLEYWEEGAWK